jgi:tRNA threonylcarbamoyl adenosine modification protein YeaZ
VKTLFIDTSHYKRACAVIIDNKIVSIKDEKNDNNLAEVMLNNIIEVLEAANIILTELDNIMVVTGPGSFTGVRVGVTIAKTMGYTKNIKVIPISSLEVMASGTESIALIDARRGYVYAGGYDNKLNNFFKDQYISLEEVTNKYKDKHFVSYTQFDNIDINKPIIDILKIVNKHINDEGVNPHSLNPNYLKLTEAEENAGK